MSESRSSRPFAHVWFPLALMLGLLGMRVLTQHQVLSGLPNLTPMLAFAFAGSIVLPKSLPWWSWFFILLGVDMISLGWDQSIGSGQGLLAYACYALAAWIGSGMRGHTSVLETLLGTLVCSVLFYIVTNSLSWWTDAAYGKNPAGWVQALTTGTPGYPPTLLFFRNSLAADLIGTVILVATYNTEAIMRHLQAMPLIGARRVILRA
ncbi:MAG: hypothetical protein RL693_755 [Verrucomicrobiota bacterium]|jgi:hypothetical protein